MIQAELRPVTRDSIPLSGTQSLRRQHVSAVLLYPNGVVGWTPIRWIISGDDTVHLLESRFSCVSNKQSMRHKRSVLSHLMQETKIQLRSCKTASAFYCLRASLCIDPKTIYGMLARTLPTAILKDCFSPFEPYWLKLTLAEFRSRKSKLSSLAIYQTIYGRYERRCFHGPVFYSDSAGQREVGSKQQQTRKSVKHIIGGNGALLKAYMRFCHVSVTTPYNDILERQLQRPSFYTENHITVCTDYEKM